MAEQTSTKTADKLTETLEAKGLRATPHRLRIASKVLSSHCHFTADEIFAWASGLKSRLSRATVYNILNEFVSVGLLKSFYSSCMGCTIYDSNVDNHFHFVDSHSKQITDIDPSLVRINTTQMKSLGYDIDQVEVLFRGRKS